MPRSAETTRRRILDAAYELFYRKGFSRVGIDEVAAFAKVTKRTLYYHFESKDALLTDMLELHSEPSLTVVRPRQRRIVVSLTPNSSARTATGLLLAWMYARTFGVVVALACNLICMMPSAP